MQYRHLGSSGLRVSAVAFGTWLTAGNTLDLAATQRLVASAAELGINFFDTADVYARGAAEEALGAALKGRPRHTLVVATKCFFPMSDDPNDKGLSRKHVVESLHGSLRRLGLDYVDLFQCHRSDPDTPLEETCRAMDDLIRQGKTLYWGVSLWSAEQIERAVQLCRAEGWAPPISNQPCYNLLDRGIEAAVMPRAAALGVGQIVYSPLAQGVLSGKYRRGAAPPPGSRATDERANRFIGRYLGDPGAVDRTERFVRLAAELGLAPSRIALAFCLRRPEVASVIVGATSAAQLEENAAAAALALDAATLRALDEIFPAP
ncbi:MAG: aldo/keto reductase family protein [Planctomycetes bacterium]|nr:aldo/keto reductase family protein [Planctomycetota bacterium]